MAGLTTAVAPLPDVCRIQTGLLGDATRPGLQAVSRLVADAEAALQEGRLQSAQSCLDVYFAEATRFHGLSAKAAPVDQFMCRAHFAAGQLVSQLSSSFKGQQLLDAVLEATGHIMKGVELAAANPRYSHLVYNGSVHYWHAARPLQCDKLRHHLLHSQEKLCQALEKVEGQPAWRVRHLLSLALCQLSDEGKPEEVPKILAKALELATAANLQPLRAEVLALQTHHQTLQAARAAAAKPGGPAAAGKAPGAAAAPAPPAAAAAKQAAPAGKRKPGDAPAAGTGKADIDGALAALQWVLSARPDAAVAEQHLQAALKLVDTRPDKPGSDAHLLVVGRIGWAAAVCGVKQLAEQCARRATTSQELRPRVWADLTRLLLDLQAAPEAALGTVHCSNGAGAVLDPAAVKARRDVLEGVDEAVAAFVKLGDVEGIHNSAVLGWNAGLPVLQPGHRSIVKPAFTAVGKALEAVGSPWAKLRAALHLEVAKAEADADSFMKAAKEVTTALSLNYPSSADMAAVCGYERPLDRFLEPMARAAQLRGVAPVQLSNSSSKGGDGVATRPDDDVVLLLERAKDSKSAPLRSEYLQKAINKLALLPAVPPPDGPATTQALQQQLQSARTRTQLWADIIELAWHPCQLEPLVRSALPFVLEAAWQPVGDKEMLLLQARAALVGADAAKAAMVKLNAELVVPAHYTPSLSLHTHNPCNSAGSEASASTTKGRAASAKAGVEQKTGSTAEDMQRLVADLYLQSMRLSVAAGGHPWLVMNAALAAWNTYLPLMQRERYADLADILLPVLQQLLQEKSSPEPNQLVMLAEAAAKAAEHSALTRVLQQQHSALQPTSCQALQQAGTGPGSASVVSSQPAPCCKVSELPWYKPLAEARGATAGLDAMVFLAGAADILQLLTDTAAACQQALTRAAAASEPQGLIQAYARLQQLQGKSVVVPPGAPAAMADTSKLLELIEGLIATAPDTGAPPAAPPAQPAAGAAAGRLSSAASAAAPARASASGAKGAPAAPAMSNAEQDIRAAMSLLATMPSVNLQLWAQLARAAGRHGFWLLVRECASAALGALPATKRQLHTITTAADVPEVTAQGWYWLSVAEMQQGQATLSLLHAAAGTGADATLSLRHSALQHFATAARLASFIRRPDLAEAAARLAYNAATAPGALFETELTRAAAVPCLSKVAVALNATRPADIGFQVQVNLLLLECLAAAGRWSDARRHVEALHRSLPLSKQKGPAAAAALEDLASWRATCLVHASSGRAMEDMTRLLAELSTPQAKACAWLAFAQASSTPAEQVSARQSALAALGNLPPAAKVEYQLKFAQWLATCPAASAPAADAGWAPEQLLLDAVSTLREAQERTGGQLGDCSSSGSSSGKGLPAGADTLEGTAAGTHRSRRSRTTADAAGGWSKADAVPWTRQMEQRIRAHVLLSQVAARLEDRQEHLLQAQECAQQMLTQSLIVSGAEVALPPTQQDPLLQESSPAHDSTEQQTSSQLSGVAASTAAMSIHGQADTTSSVTAPEQVPKAVVPTLDLLAGPASAAMVASAVTNDADRRMQGLVQGNKLPTCMLDWAIWLPTDGLVHQLSSPASDPCNQPAVGIACPAPAVASAVLGGADAHSAAGLVAAAAGAVLSRSCVPAHEMLLANLQVLAEQLQAAGCHAAALPVLQLARLVAVVTLNSQVAAAAHALQLSTLCEHLGLSAAAADWLKLAGPEQWPSPEQLQQAEQAQAVQQLAQDVLQQHTNSCAATTADVVTAATGSSPTPEQAQAAFLLDALHSANPATLQAWLHTSSSAQRSGRDSSKPSGAQGTRRPSSAAGAGAAAAVQAAVAGGVQPGKVGVLLAKPLTVLDSWVSIARYLVDHAQYTAGQKLCGFALQQARSCKDSQQEAQVLLLQARLALLAQHWEAAVHLSQAAQAIGGGVQLWADSVLCYAAARNHMPGRGPADALEALEGGVALLATVARGCPRSCMPIIAAASSRLKQQLARDIAAKAQQQLVDGQDDAASCRSAVQLHARAVLLAREAAVDAQQAGAVLLHVAAQQQVAQLLISQPGSVLTQLPQQSQSLQSFSAAPLQDKAAALEALACLQAAQAALAALPSFSHGVPAAEPTLTSPWQQGIQAQAGVHSAPSGRNPTAHMTVSVLTALSQVELLISRTQLRDGQAIQPSAEPDFPRVDGRDPRAVIAFLTAGASSMADQVDADNAMVHLERALQHAAQAAEAAAAANQPSLHAAALLALGKAHMLQAHVAMLQQQGNVPVVQPLVDGDRSRSNCASASHADLFERAWVPWPRDMASLIPVSAAAMGADSASSGPVAVDGAASVGQAASGLDSGSGQALPSPLAAVLPDQPANSSLRDDRAQPSLQLPDDAAEPYQQATMRLHGALQQALQHQQLQTAQAAARALAHCYGQLQPDGAALYLAVAQSCSNAMAMRHSFEQAAAEQHMELLLWRQLEHLEAGWKGASVHDQQAQHMLSLLGITNKRLQVPQTDALVPLLSQLQPHQRLILLHHDADKQQLVLAAWGMPVSKTRSGPVAAPGCAAGPAATAASTHSSPSGGGMQSARARTSFTIEPPPPAGIEASAAAPPPALLASMPCTQEQISELTSTFNAYSRQLQKAIAQAAGQAVPSPTVTTPEVSAGPGAAVSEGKKQPAAAAGKAGAKDKGSKDAASEVPPWVPPMPVFPAEHNEQWQQLLRQFEAFLQPVSSLFQDAMQQPVVPVEASAPAAKPSTKASKSAAAPPAGPLGAAPVPLGIQLLLDLQLCELPWEALPALKQSCGSIARCLSLAQLQHLQQPPHASGQQLPGAQPAAANSSSSGGSPAALLELNKLSYLVDPLHLMSSVADGPRCYCAPLLPSFRQQLADVWGQDWQGFAGSDSQTPGEEQLLRPLVGSKGLLVLAPGRLLNYISTQSVAGLDLTSCTAALLIDRLDSPTAAAHQTKIDNQKTAAQRALEGPSQAALLLLLRGVRSVAVAALPGTPHTHLHLASSVLRCLSGAPVQTLQAPSSTLSGASAGTAVVAGKDTALSATTLGEAVCMAQRQGLAGFELQALRDAGFVLYGLENAVLGEGGGTSKAKAPRKG